jgi:hypothetical protein
VPVGYFFSLTGGTGSVDGNGNAGTFDHLTGLDGCAVGSATTSGVPGATSAGGDAGTLTISAAGQSQDITITAPVVHTLTLKVTAPVAAVDTAYTLSIGGGSGGFSPPGQATSCTVTVPAAGPAANGALCGTFTFNEGTVVSISASPLNTSWSGDCTGTPPTSSVTMDGDKSCTGEWAAAP